MRNVLPPPMRAGCPRKNFCEKRWRRIQALDQSGWIFENSAQVWPRELCRTSNREGKECQPAPSSSPASTRPPQPRLGPPYLCSTACLQPGSPPDPPTPITPAASPPGRLNPGPAGSSRFDRPPQSPPHRLRAAGGWAPRAPVRGGTHHILAPSSWYHVFPCLSPFA